MTKSVGLFRRRNRRTLSRPSRWSRARRSAAAPTSLGHQRPHGLQHPRGSRSRIFLPTLHRHVRLDGRSGLLFDTTPIRRASPRDLHAQRQGLSPHVTDRAAWSETSFDADDTVKTSPYYLGNIGNTDPDFALEREGGGGALIKSRGVRGHAADGPFRPPGRVTIPDGPEAGVLGSTPTMQVLFEQCFTVDAQGRVTESADPRFSPWNAGNVGQALQRAKPAYDMGERLWLLTSCDAGTTRQARRGPMASRPISGGAADVLISRGYDHAAPVPPAVRVDGGGLAQIVEVFSYGTGTRPAISTEG